METPAFVEWLRSLTGSQRSEMALDMSNSLRKRLADRLLRQHPEYTEEQARLIVIRLFLGGELFRRAFPDANSD